MRCFWLCHAVRRTYTNSQFAYAAHLIRMAHTRMVVFAVIVVFIFVIVQIYIINERISLSYVCVCDCVAGWLTLWLAGCD